MSKCSACGGFYNEACKQWPLCTPAEEPEQAIEIAQLKDKLIAVEKRASNTTKTFVDLRKLIEVNIAANTELVRELNEARTQTGVWIARATKIETERDAAQVALAQASNMWTETVLNPVKAELDGSKTSITNLRSALENLIRAGAREILHEGRGCTAAYVDAESKARTILTSTQ